MNKPKPIKLDWKITFQHAVFCLSLLNKIIDMERANPGSKLEQQGTLAYDFKNLYFQNLARMLYILRTRTRENGKNTDFLMDKYSDIWNETKAEGHHNIIPFSMAFSNYLNCLNDILGLLQPKSRKLLPENIVKMGTQVKKLIMFWMIILK